MSGFNTYAAAFTGLNPGVAATTVIAELVCTGAAEIQLLKVVVSGSEATASAVNNLQLVKESTNSTGGAKTGVLGVPFTTLNSTPATATLNGYTVTPVAGALVGILGAQALVLGLGATGVGGSTVTFDFTSLAGGAFGQPPALNLVNEAFALTFGGATPANAPALNIYFWWQEVPLLT